MSQVLTLFKPGSDLVLARSEAGPTSSLGPTGLLRLTRGINSFSKTGGREGTFPFQKKGAPAVLSVNQYFLPPSTQFLSLLWGHTNCTLWLYDSNH